MEIVTVTGTYSGCLISQLLKVEQQTVDRTLDTSLTTLARCTLKLNMPTPLDNITTTGACIISSSPRR